MENARTPATRAQAPSASHHSHGGPRRRRRGSMLIGPGSCREVYPNPPPMERDISDLARATPVPPCLCAPIPCAARTPQEATARSRRPCDHPQVSASPPEQRPRQAALGPRRPSPVPPASVGKPKGLQRLGGRLPVIGVVGARNWAAMALRASSGSVGAGGVAVSVRFLP